MNEVNSTVQIQLNKYSDQFKDQAVDRAEVDGVAQVARDLGISQSMLYAWRAKKRLSGSPIENQKTQQAEMARLKREVARLSQENAFLKKAAAYFAKDQQ